MLTKTFLSFISLLYQRCKIKRGSPQLFFFPLDFYIPLDNLRDRSEFCCLVDKCSADDFSVFHYDAGIRINFFRAARDDEAIGLGPHIPHKTDRDAEPLRCIKRNEAKRLARPRPIEC